MQAAFITLGCSKNLVDSEMIVGLLEKNNFKIINNLKEADLIFINTCGFIQSAKEEAITTIFDTLKIKKEEADIFVVGCFAQRYFEILKEEIPEVDKFIKIDDYSRIGTIINNHYKKPLIAEEGLDFLVRSYATGPYFGYVRVADGCDNRCSFCAIPLIRGNFKSRTIDDIVLEVKTQVAEGHKEINLISQDTTNYGKDIGYTLLDLLKEVVKVKGIDMVRLLYLYPSEISDELIDFIAKNKVIAPYFDIPIQHASNKILALMKRKDNQEKIRSVVSKIRAKIPHAILRTTVIVGFPHEDEDDFNELITLIKDLEFDRLGAFTYSNEEDTKAIELDNHVEKSVKEDRYNKLMKVQKQIAHKKSLKRVGDITFAYVDSYDSKMKSYKLRDYSYAPDGVDGYIYLKTNNKLELGNMVKVEITNAYFYDLIAKEVYDN